MHKHFPEHKDKDFSIAMLETISSTTLPDFDSHLGTSFRARTKSVCLNHSCFLTHAAEQTLVYIVYKAALNPCLLSARPVLFPSCHHCSLQKGMQSWRTDTWPQSWGLNQNLKTDIHSHTLEGLFKKILINCMQLKISLINISKGQNLHQECPIRKNK